MRFVGYMERIASPGLVTGLAVASGAAFVVARSEADPHWELATANHTCDVLLVLTVAAALAVKRRPSVVAAKAQIAAAAVAIVFAIIALARLYAASGSGLALGRVVASASSWSDEAVVMGLAAFALGLIGFRVQSSVAIVGLAASGCASIASVVFAISLETDSRAYVWYSVAAVLALIAGSATARAQRR